MNSFNVHSGHQTVRASAQSFNQNSLGAFDRRRRSKLLDNAEQSSNGKKSIAQSIAERTSVIPMTTKMYSNKKSFNFTGGLPGSESIFDEEEELNMSVDSSQMSSQIGGHRHEVKYSNSILEQDVVIEEEEKGYLSQ
jgi:hypothetical protein